MNMIRVYSSRASSLLFFYDAFNIASLVQQCVFEVSVPFCLLLNEWIPQSHCKSSLTRFSQLAIEAVLEYGLFTCTTKPSFFFEKNAADAFVNKLFFAAVFNENFDHKTCHRSRKEKIRFIHRTAFARVLSHFDSIFNSNVIETEILRNRSRILGSIRNDEKRKRLKMIA